MSLIRPGELRHQIDVQSFTLKPDGAGGSSKAWTSVNPGIWASVVPINGGEPFSQGVQRATQFYRVMVRWRTGISARNRLMWNGVPLNIRTCADPDGTRAALVMTVESGSGD